MDRKSILIVSASFYPEISPRSFRATELSREFARQGHSVTMLIPGKKEIHTAFERENGITIKDLGVRRWKIPGFGKSKPGYILHRILFRILSLTFEFPDIELMWLVRKALRNESGYDLLISIAVPYPVHWGVALVWNKKRPAARTWVADCGDPYMGCTLDSFRKPFYFRYVEKWFMRKADYITITKKEFKVNYYAEFHDKMVEIPQGFRFEDIQIAASHPNNQIPHFAYAGSFIKGKRDPFKLLSYLASLNIDFRFILYTKTRDLVDPFLPLLKDKIEIKTYIPREQLLSELSKMDFLVNFEYNPRVQSPSKLIDYELTKRPVLNIISEEFDPETVDEFLSGDYENRFKIPDFEKYRIENVCTGFLKLLNGSEC
jgi:hypothetical protein